MGIFLVVISLGSVKIPLPKYLKIFPGPVKSFTVKKNRIVVVQTKKLTTLYNRIIRRLAKISNTDPFKLIVYFIEINIYIF